MATVVREPPKNKHDGYIGVQLHKHPEYHLFWTQIDECILPFSMYFRIAMMLRCFFEPRGCEIHIKLTVRANLVICVFVPIACSSRTVRRYTKNFGAILRRLGLMMNPIFCPLRTQ